MRFLKTFLILCTFTTSVESVFHCVQDGALLPHITKSTQAACNFDFTHHEDTAITPKCGFKLNQSRAQEAFPAFLLPSCTSFADCQAANVADIVFIVDESGSIGTPNFQLVRTFLHLLVSGLEVRPNRVRVGIVSYSDAAQAQVYLNTFQQKSELLDFIKILPYHGGGTNTGAALDFARKTVFTKRNGSRKDSRVQQVAVVITDGKSQDNVSTPAANLRRAGVTIYALGVKDADEDELRQLASHPSNKYMFTVDSFSKLKPLQQSMQKILCQNIIQQAVSVTSRTTNLKEGVNLLVFRHQIT